MSTVVPLGRAGIRESFDWYVTMAEKAATASQQRQAKMLVILDHTGIVAAVDRAPERRHWVVAHVTHSVDPDVLARKIEAMAIDKGFDEGKRKNPRNRQRS